MKIKMNNKKYVTDLSYHISDVLNHLNSLKLVLTENERHTAYLIINANITTDERNEAFKYWDNILEERVNDDKFFLALFTSVAPFLLTLIMILIGMSLLSSLFKLKRRFKQQKKDEKTLILYSENGDSGGFCHKISVIDEMKRRKPFIHSHYPHYHRPNPTDFKLPDENKVPMVLVQDELAKDIRDEASRLNAFETFNNKTPVLLNVNELRLPVDENDIKRITSSEISEALQVGNKRYETACDIHNYLASYDEAASIEIFESNEAKSSKSILKKTTPVLNTKFYRKKSSQVGDIRSMPQDVNQTKQTLTEPSKFSIYKVIEHKIESNEADTDTKL